MKLAVLFPGIGYTCDKPLLYYAARLARASGYDVLPVAYGGFPKNVRGDIEKTQRCLELACAQAEERLSGVRWGSCEDILFVGKSIGTVVAARYAHRRRLSVQSVLFTPLVETFDEARGSAIAFHGTADPWADTAEIVSACKRRGIPLFLTENANHSLETGDVAADIAALADAMEKVRQFIVCAGEGA